MADNVNNNKKVRVFNFRLGADELIMMQKLKDSPHFVNIPEFFRASLRNLYNKKIKKEEEE